VSAKADELRARRIEWTAKFGATPWWFIDLLVARGKNLYLVEYGSLAKLTGADRATFDPFIGSLDLK
jgi:hypothetical protein